MVGNRALGWVEFGLGRGCHHWKGHVATLKKGLEEKIITPHKDFVYTSLIYMYNYL